MEGLFSSSMIKTFNFSTSNYSNTLVEDADECAMWSLGSRLHQLFQQLILATSWEKVVQIYLIDLASQLAAFNGTILNSVILILEFKIAVQMVYKLLD